jgi:aspartate aminotransferase
MHIMPPISDLANSVAESATMKFNERAARLRAKGKPVIHLGIGEPKNLAPQAALQASSEKLENGMLKYTPAAGLPSLRAAIADFTTERYGVEVGAKNLIACNGSKHALFNVLMAIVNPGDEVVFPTPYWVSYPEMVKLVRGVPVAVKPQSGTLQPSASAVIDAISDRTRAVILNTPNNPSGMLYPPEFISALVRECESRSVYLIMDDIYRELVFDGRQAPSAFAYTEAEIESTHLVIVHGVSKLYGMTGVRLGWAVGPSELVVAMNRLQGQMTSNASVLSQAAAEGALTGDQAAVDDLLRHLESNRDAMLEQLPELAELRVEKPGGGLYCFPDFSAYGRDSLALADFLLDKVLVATVPGVEFGMDGHLRLGFAGTREDVVEGIRRIRWALDASQPQEIKLGDQLVVRDWA